MTTYRAKRKRNPFAMIDVTPLRDIRLSWKARGILAFLLTKPDDWVTSEVNLINESESDGRDSLRSGMNELKRLGYIARVRTRSPLGFFEWETYIFETPEDREKWEQENPQFTTTDGLSTDGLSTDGLSTDGLSTDGLSTDGKPVDIHIKERRITDLRIIEERKKEAEPADADFSFEELTNPEPPGTPQAIATIAELTNSIPVKHEDLGSGVSDAPHFSAVEKMRAIETRMNAGLRPHRYPELVEQGLGELWVGPQWNDFDERLLQAAARYLKMRELPCGAMEARNYVKNRIKQQDWGALEDRWAEAVNYVEQPISSSVFVAPPPSVPMSKEEIQSGIALLRQSLANGLAKKEAMKNGCTV
jgi:hypothetical protein